MTENKKMDALLALAQEKRDQKRENITDSAPFAEAVVGVAKLAATETKKQSLLTEKQDKYYKKVLKKWKKEEKITVHKGTWNKIDFTKLSVKAKDTSTTGTSTDSASGN